jgi:hypothetical protein
MNNDKRQKAKINWRQNQQLKKVDARLTGKIDS